MHEREANCRVLFSCDSLLLSVDFLFFMHILSGNSFLNNNLAGAVFRRIMYGRIIKSIAPYHSAAHHSANISVCSVYSVVQIWLRLCRAAYFVVSQYESS